MMDKFSSILGDREIYVYLDDILIIEELKAVLDRLIECNLRFFIRSRIKYLRHIISPLGIETDPFRSRTTQL